MSKRRTRLVHAVKFLRGVLVLIAVFGLLFGIGYLLICWIGWGTLGDFRSFLPYLAADVVSSLLLILIGVVIHLITRPNQRKIRGEVNEALRRIARGDFNVILAKNKEEDGWFGEFRESINNMAQELKQVEGMRQEFISTVSHEIQSPLTSIRGFAVALQDVRLSPAERKHYLSIIEMESMRLSKLGDNLMRLTALEGDGPVLHTRPFRLDKQLRKAVLTLEPQWLDKEQELDVELVEAVVTGDEQLLDQVWINLLHNAIKFTPQGGTIRLTLEERGSGPGGYGVADRLSGLGGLNKLNRKSGTGGIDGLDGLGGIDGTGGLSDVSEPGGQVGSKGTTGSPGADSSQGVNAPERSLVVRIADSGPGIPQADQLRIFERFYRGDKARSRRTEGSGLGLSIAKKIVDLHGGTITVESRPGEGAEFEVILPIGEPGGREG